MYDQDAHATYQEHPITLFMLDQPSSELWQ